jgi:hypothetical protein
MRLSVLPYFFASSQSVGTVNNKQNIEQDVEEEIRDEDVPLQENPVLTKGKM